MIVAASSGAMAGPGLVEAPSRSYWTMHNLPAARVVREAGREVAAPRVTPDQLRAELAPLVERGKRGLAVAFGLWPLTAVLLCAAALLWAVGVANSP